MYTYRRVTAGVVADGRGDVEAVGRAVADHAQSVVSGDCPLHDAQHRAVHVHVDDPAGSRSAGVAVIEQAGDRLGREQAGQIAGDVHSWPGRRPVGITGEVHEPAESQRVPVEARLQRLRAVLAEHAEAGCHHPGWKSGGVDVPAFEGAGAEALAHHVAGGGQGAEDLLALGAAQVEGHRLSAPALHRPVEGVHLAVVLYVGAELAQAVASPGFLDLDDFGALFAQDPRAERSRYPRPQVDHPQSFQGSPHHTHSVLLISRSASSKQRSRLLRIPAGSRAPRRCARPAGERPPAPAASCRRIGDRGLAGEQGR